jgi:hypothetical protein
MGVLLATKQQIEQRKPLNPVVQIVELFLILELFGINPNIEIRLCI